ncbi:MAG: GNAT family N-acetyltransferase [Chloroflexi bacterium]|nr:GNAT family N-acetyltransferase [Chloroflexota bacterium]
MLPRRHYEIVSHADLGDLARQIYTLTQACFATYPGVIEPSEAHRVWYLRRPGMDAALSSAVLFDGQVVSSVFVTRVMMRLGGELVPVGMVDTVMTHPDHRRRGLASAVLSRALLGMRSEGFAAAALSTLLGSMPYRFYESLGFRLATPMDYLLHLGPDKPKTRTAEVLSPEEDGQAVAFLNAHFAEHEGYIPYDEPLWRWRKRERPAELPAEHCLLRDERGDIAAFASLCHAPILTGSGTQPVTIFTDLALPENGEDAHLALRAFLGRIPEGRPAGVLVARCNEAEVRLLTACGFQHQYTEAAMILPFWPALEAALARAPKRWYPVVESVIGV